MTFSEPDDDAPVALLSTDIGGAIVGANRTLERWTGYDRAHLLAPMRLHDLLAPGARIYYETHVAPLLQMQGSVREIAVELVRADGGRLPVLMSATVVRDQDGASIVRTMLVDASERRRYERELLRARADAETRARSALALGHVSDGVVLVDDAGRVELMNTAAERIFRVAAAEAVGRPAEEVIESWREVAAGSPARDADRAAAQIVPARRGGDEQWLAVAAVDTGDGIVYTVRDVTAERKLDQIRSDLIATVSHELRTPLTGIYGAAATLLGRDPDLAPEVRRNLLETVVQQAARLTAIVEQILAADGLAGLEIDVDVVDAAAALTGLSVSPRLVVDAPEGIRVRADLDRLRQVVANLVDNALKYSVGPVHVRLERRQLFARISVSDEGPGVPPGEHERIFEKFYRLDPDQRSGVSGTGLGLYIARELVERMGGRIGLVDRAGGATFYVDVPAG